MTGSEFALLLAGVVRVGFWVLGAAYGFYRRSVLQTVVFSLAALSSSIFLFSNALGRESVPRILFEIATFASTPIAAMFVALMFAHRGRNESWRIW